MLSGCYGGSRPPNIGTAAPGFTVQDSDRKVSLDELRGKVVVLNFWATWCPPCVEEAPALNRLQERIAPRGGVVIGVSIDDDPDKYEKLLKDFGVLFPTWRDPSAKVMHDYGTVMIPETYIIDRHGRIARKIIGPQRWDSPELTAYFDYLLTQS